LTNHDAAESLYVATDRDATPPRVHATPPSQYGLEFGPGVFGSARPKSRLFSAVLGGKCASLGPHFRMGRLTRVDEVLDVVLHPC